MDRAKAHYDSYVVANVVMSIVDFIDNAEPEMNYPVARYDS